MTDDDHTTHAALAEQLAEIVARLRSDVESRSDPVLGEITAAIELLGELTAHAHSHVLENNQRLNRLEGER